MNGRLTVIDLGPGDARWPSPALIRRSPGSVP
jgi:hypothetical protein